WNGCARWTSSTARSPPWCCPPCWSARPRQSRPMPEGDSVYQAAARLRAVLAGKTLLRGEIRHPRLSTVDLSGKTVSAVRTVGKHLFVEFDGRLSLHNHLGLDGTWQIYPAGGRWRRPAHQARVVLATAEHEVVGFLLHELKLLRLKEERLIV